MKNIGEKAKIASNHMSNLDIKKRNSVLKQFCINFRQVKKLKFHETKTFKTYQLF